MRQEKVDEMLKAYRMDAGRCGHLEIEIKRLEKAIDIEIRNLAENSAAIKSQKLSDMPHGSEVGSPTERIGIALASGWMPEEIRQMKEELRKYEDEYKQKSITVMFVSAWLNGLSEKERWIVERQIIDGEYWKSVVGSYRREFAEDVSKDSLKRLKQRAMSKIYAMAE